MPFLMGEQDMSIREHRELTASELEIVTGGGMKEIVQSAVDAASSATPGNGSYVGGKNGVSGLPTDFEGWMNLIYG